MRHSDDLLCDFAQFYHITDLRGLPVGTLAALACGLPEESRTVRRQTGARLTVEQTLLAAICDRLSVLCWQNTEDAREGRNYPRSILAELTGTEEEKPIAYGSPEEFEAERARLMGGDAECQ